MIAQIGLAANNTYNHLIAVDRTQIIVIVEESTERIGANTNQNANNHTVANAIFVVNS
ncbi:MAG: hypothetical protein PF569_04740 [Candidatus Woesearchaeota archaeon]|jgi:hypothetical protein|nr:hypothetical protein [Candidatus Woesearchaeota archaeon]